MITSKENLEAINKMNKELIEKQITNTGKVCMRCHKREGLHQTDKEGNHLFCYMDDSSDEFVSSKLFQSAVKETEEYKQGFKDGKIIREKARGRAYQMGFEVGKQQATKELLNKELKFCKQLWNQAREYTCDGWVVIRTSNRIFDIEQQLSKLGEKK